MTPKQKNHIQKTKKWFKTNHNKSTPEPLLFPMVNEGTIAEWRNDKNLVSVEFDQQFKTAYAHSYQPTNKTTDEKTFTLTPDNNPLLIEWIKQHT